MCSKSFSGSPGHCACSPLRNLNIHLIEQIPYIPKERFGGQYSLLSALGGERRACVACGTTRQCSFATGAPLTAQELYICVILLEIRGGAVGIVFTGFGTLVIKAQKEYITSESGPQYHILEGMIVSRNGGKSVSRQMSQYERNQCSETALKKNQTRSSPFVK